MFSTNRTVPDIPLTLFASASGGGEPPYRADRQWVAQDPRGVNRPPPLLYTYVSDFLRHAGMEGQTGTVLSVLVATSVLGIPMVGAHSDRHLRKLVLSDVPALVHIAAGAWPVQDPRCCSFSRPRAGSRAEPWPIT
ncbi:hypothetical protein [Kutzneria sp. 744]|uniref:hypothetical protein n=1 Tax=Kutzneria sp. (strain 744) TaxID=345341 RepID=UPI0003EEC323|nr:hypothetical protein [Kutzneria sp. 744]EWM11916.1 hypothetical protein KUTG_02220 [Kutzneria sp. 744]